MRGKAVAEPTLDELLEESIIRLVMAADGVSADDLRDLVDAIKLRVNSQEQALAARRFWPPEEAQYSHGS